MVRKPKTEKKKIEISLDEFRSRIKGVDLNTYFIFGSIILVLGIGLYALFSSTAQNARLANPACGKIVVAADGSSLKSKVSPTLSDAKYFLVINPLSSKLLEAAKNPYTGKQGGDMNLAYFVAGKGEEAVIAGGIEPQYYRVLAQFGVRGFAGYSGKVKDVISLYRQARVSREPLGEGSGAGMQQAAFGFGERLFVCPACNWRMRMMPHGNTYPKCPNCSMPMARHFSRHRHDGWWPAWDPFGTVANTVVTQRGQPSFWQGPESTGFFICPKCNWRMYSQKDMGQYPRCPNCKAMMARGGAYYQNARNPQWDAPAALADTVNSLKAPPIYPGSTMPHGYRGVCSNCHQILKRPPGSANSQGASATQVAWSSGRQCILR